MNYQQKLKKVRITSTYCWRFSSLSCRTRYLYSRSSNRYNGRVAKRSVKKSLKITSQVNENTHPRSDTAQPLIDVHQLTNTIKTISHIITTAAVSVLRSTRANLPRLDQIFESSFLILPSAKTMCLGHNDEFQSR